jgi:histidine triad (HIT) family protein
MYNHEPAGYVCPFCLIARGVWNEHVLAEPSDLIYNDPHITAFVACDWWPNNNGHVLVIPNQHIENIYDLPAEMAGRIHGVARGVALAFKEVYRCDGVSTRQHNEPAGNQDLWHYHLHVFPRYRGDNLYKSDKRRTQPHERVDYAARLRNYLQDRLPGCGAASH